jgi:hypothetical protein
MYLNDTFKYRLEILFHLRYVHRAARREVKDECQNSEQSEGHK